MNYYFSKELNLSFNQAIEKVTNAMKEQGFGVVVEVFISELLKEKIGVEMKPYKVLVVCHPNFAYRAIQAEEHIGLMLPCNVLVQEVENEKVEVSVIDPASAMSMINNPRLNDIALQVGEILKKVIENL
ncbi:MAG: DUF302 domain-containing protein [Candidatus Kapaibacteriales bacterium]